MGAALLTQPENVKRVRHESNLKGAEENYSSCNSCDKLTFAY